MSDFLRLLNEGGTSLSVLGIYARTYLVFSLIVFRTYFPVPLVALLYNKSRLPILTGWSHLWLLFQESIP